MNEQMAKLLRKVSEPLRDAPDIFSGGGAPGQLRKPAIPPVDGRYGGHRFSSAMHGRRIIIQTLHFLQILRMDQRQRAALT